MAGVIKAAVIETAVVEAAVLEAAVIKATIGKATVAPANTARAKNHQRQRIAADLAGGGIHLLLADSPGNPAQPGFDAAGGGLSTGSRIAADHRGGQGHAGIHRQRGHDQQNADQAGTGEKRHRSRAANGTKNGKEERKEGIVRR